MYIYISICIYTYMYIHVYIFIYIYTYMCLHIYMYMCKSAYVYYESIGQPVITASTQNAWLHSHMWTHALSEFARVCTYMYVHPYKNRSHLYKHSIPIMPPPPPPKTNCTPLQKKNTWQSQKHATALSHHTPAKKSFFHDGLTNSTYTFLSAQWWF